MKRIQSVDVFRFAAVVMVITLHTVPFSSIPPNPDFVWLSSFYSLVSLGINNFSRFAVPFFFVISGYFWGKKIQNGGEPMASSLLTIKRIFFILLFWNLIYLIPFEAVGSHVDISEFISLTAQNAYAELHKPFSLLLMQGTKGHLWFLVSLMFSMGLCAVFIKNGAKKHLIVFASVLYIIGLLIATSYVNTPIGIPISNVDLRILNNSIGPFFSTIFFASGYLLSELKPASQWLAYGLVVFVIGVIIQFLEIYFLWKFFGGNLTQEFGLGTIFMGTGIAIVSLSDHPGLQNAFLSRIGQMVLGIYLSHYIFVDILSGISHSPAWEIGYVIAVFISSMAVTYFLSKNKLTRAFVM